MALQKSAEVKVGELLALAEAGLVSARVHPQFGTHSQANHRWSTTKPPMAQLPPHLEGLFVPDPEWPWLGWDSDTQELRIIAAEAKDRPLLNAFKGGHDVHTLTTTEVFGYRYPDNRVDPHFSLDNAAWRQEVAWQGKKDGRRTFAKQFFYSLNYGKKPKNAIHIPGARALGFTGPRLERAAQRLLAAHPALAAWRAKQKERCLRLKQARDFMGGRRVFHGMGDDLVRAAYDFPMQAGGVRMFNQTLLEIYRQFPGVVQFKYQQHDSAWLAIRRDVWGEEIRRKIASIVTREWDINGTPTVIPATFYTWEHGSKKQPWTYCQT